MTKQALNEDFATVTLFSGGFNGECLVRGEQKTFSIARPAVALDVAKLAKARADVSRVAVLMGWE